MTTIKTRIHVASDGTITGRARGLPAGEHDAEIMLIDRAEPTACTDPATLLARVRAIQQELSQMRVLDSRSPDELIGYNEHGHFD